METGLGRGVRALPRAASDPRLPDYYFASTPAELLSELHLGSRPSRRPDSSAASTACARSRGCSAGRSRARSCPAGTAWAAASRPRARRAWASCSPRCTPTGASSDNFLSNVAMTLTKTDIGLARHYVERLAPPELHGVFEADPGEYELSVAELLRVTGEDELLGANPVLRRTLAVRDAYLAPLHYLQVELIERWRADRAAGARAGLRRGARAAPERQRHRRRPAQHGLALRAQRLDRVDDRRVDILQSDLGPAQHVAHLADVPRQGSSRDTVAAQVVRAALRACPRRSRRRTGRGLAVEHDGVHAIARGRLTDTAPGLRPRWRRSSPLSTRGAPRCRLGLDVLRDGASMIDATGPGLPGASLELRRSVRRARRGRAGAAATTRDSDAQTRAGCRSIEHAEHRCQGRDEVRPRGYADARPVARLHTIRIERRRAPGCR